LFPLIREKQAHSRRRRYKTRNPSGTDTNNNPITIPPSSSNKFINGFCRWDTVDYNTALRTLADLGLEPRGDFTNKNDPEKLFLAINSAIEAQAKTHGFDYVCYPENPTMHSNRGQLASKISEHIRNRKTIPLDIRFPKDHESYTTKQLYITWSK
jgi:hypothetical protein